MRWNGFFPAHLNELERKIIVPAHLKELEQNRNSFLKLELTTQFQTEGINMHCTWT